MNQKLVISVFVVLIVGLALFAVVPLVVALALGPGVKTEPLNAEGAKPASSDINGQWQIVNGSPPNVTAVGFTFNEVLPNERRETSGSTQGVTGHVTIEGENVTAGEVTADMNTIMSDSDVRDSNVRRKLFHTDKYPEATFVLTEPVDVSSIPEDGTPGEVQLTGDLTITGHTESISEDFLVLRDGNKLVVSGTVMINRNDFGVESPEMIAAQIADEGEINILLSMEK